jgi:hypothetical protein
MKEGELRAELRRTRAELEHFRNSYHELQSEKEPSPALDGEAIGGRTVVGWDTLLSVISSPTARRRYLRELIAAARAEGFKEGVEEMRVSVFEVFAKRECEHDCSTHDSRVANDELDTIESLIRELEVKP